MYSGDDQGNFKLSTEVQANEIEAWGVTYERYALEKKLGQLTHKYTIRNVAEIPAHGAKAMPSIYSIGFGLAGAKVTLINGAKEYVWCWNKVGLQDTVRFVRADSLYHTKIPDNTFDFVWNFAYLPMDKDKQKLITEMKRISSRYVAFFSVNYGNSGFHVHRAVHKIKNVPWTHGDIYYNKRRKIVLFMKKHGLRIAETGFVDCPIWPDSLGFRDMRLHRQNITFDEVVWTSPYIENLASNCVPFWVKCVHAWERIPNLLFIKSLYAHLNYVIGEKV